MESEQISSHEPETIYRKLMKALFIQDKPIHIQELTEITNLKYSTVRRYLANGYRRGYLAKYEDEEKYSGHKKVSYTIKPGYVKGFKIYLSHPGSYFKKNKSKISEIKKKIFRTLYIYGYLNKKSMSSDEISEISGVARSTIVPYMCQGYYGRIIKREREIVLLGYNGIRIIKDKFSINPKKLNYIKNILDDDKQK